MAHEKLIVEISSTGERTVKKNIEDLGHAAREAKNPIESLKHALELAGVGFSLVEVIKELGAFENAIGRAKVLSGLTGKEFKTLRDAAREVGETTRFSSTEA